MATATEPTPFKRVMIYGGITGWIGQKLAELLAKDGKEL
jgi:hypothetical protein